MNESPENIVACYLTGKLPDSEVDRLSAPQKTLMYWFPQAIARLTDNKLNASAALLNSIASRKVSFGEPLPIQEGRRKGSKTEGITELLGVGGIRARLIYWRESNNPGDFHYNSSLTIRAAGEGVNVDFVLKPTGSDLLILEASHPNSRQLRVCPVPKMDSFSNSVLALFDYVKPSLKRTVDNGSDQELLGHEWAVERSLLDSLPDYMLGKLSVNQKLARKIWYQSYLRMAEGIENPDPAQKLLKKALDALGLRAYRSLEMLRVWDMEQREQNKLVIGGFRNPSIRVVEITQTPLQTSSGKIQIPELGIQVTQRNGLTTKFLLEAINRPRIVLPKMYDRDLYLSVGSGENRKYYLDTTTVGFINMAFKDLMGYFGWKE